MYDGGKIIAGLVLFAAFALFPFFWSNAMGTEAGAPELAKAKPGTQCVQAKETMREGHMQILNRWRDEVVRSGDHYFTGEDGLVHEKSLTNTCLDCHGERAQFCDKCHAYAGVAPYCWDCHVTQEGK